MKIAYNLDLNKYVVVSFDGKNHTYLKGTPEFEKVVEFIRKKDDKGLEDFLHSFKRSVETRYNGVFRVENNIVFVKNPDGSEDSLPRTLGDRVREFAEADLPYAPLIKFWHRLNQNPSFDSVHKLFEFLDINHHPLLPDGRFLAYRKVRRHKDGNLYDIYTGKVLNNVGEKPRMPRNQVDDNNQVTCSRGYHCSAISYAATVYGNSNDILTEVAVCPSDVVAVPNDYNQQKMRICGYEVLNIIKEENPNKLLCSYHETGEEFNDSEICEDCGEYVDDCSCGDDDDCDCDCCS